jgi:hypothetical protein
LKPSSDAPRAYLSKSRLAAFEQCPKRLWLEFHKCELAACQQDAKAELQQGRQVGAIARLDYPDGVMIGEDGDLGRALQSTQDLVASSDRRPLFEATFSHEDVLVRVDLLIPSGDRWNIAEVKSTGSVKEYQLCDLATQVWVARGSGIEIASASIRHIDTSFLYSHPGDYRGLFVDADQTENITRFVARRPEAVGAAKATIRGVEPQIPMGAHCNNPYACPFADYCGRDLPPAPDYPVTLLPDRKGKLAADAMLEAGYADLRHVPQDWGLSGRLKRIHQVTRDGVEYRNVDALRNAIKDWSYPRYYLDFETIGFAIPHWLNTRPFQTIPFQFSCHIEQADGEICHREFLDTSGDNPSRACAEALVRALGTTGAVITYNASFERGCIKGLAQRFPDLAPALTPIAERIVDLLPLVREHYYHPDMRGSFSIKAVLPARVPHLSYKALPGVKDGLAAQVAYQEALEPGTPKDRVDKIRSELLQYCHLDTWAMVQLTHSLCLPT